MNSLRFGTEGLGGAPEDMVGNPARDWTATFLAHARTCGTARTVFVGRGAGEAAGRIASDCIEAAWASGFHAVDCGEVAGPALALAGMEAGVPSVMVTGDRVPAGSNGIAFNMPPGSLSRDDEEAMRRLRIQRPAKAALPFGQPVAAVEVEGAYAARVSNTLGRQANEGMRVAVIDDGGSALAGAVARVMRETGADVVVLSPGQPVPTGTHAVVTPAGGDAALALPDGIPIPDEAVALLACHYLGAAGVAVPVTVADGFADDGLRALRVPVDLAAVVAGMEAMAREGRATVVGVAPAGGIMLWRREGGAMPRVPDRTLAAAAALAWCREAGTTPAEFVAAMGTTVVGDVPGIDGDRTRALVRNIVDDNYFRDALFAEIGRARATDETDGLHVTFGDGRTLHLRASVGGPGLRCHARAADAAAACGLLARGMKAVAEAAAA